MKKKRTEKKRFDCIEMMHRGALRIQKETSGMSLEEELTYWRGASERLRSKLSQDAQSRARN